jgi:tetratricopeptide (TPR) repeat protein
LTMMRGDSACATNKGGAKRRPLTPAFWSLCLAIALVTAALYWRTAGFPFVYDDVACIAENPIVQRGLTSTGLHYAWTQPIASQWHPLTTMSFMLVVELFGKSAGPQHVLNVLLHIANSLLLMLFLTRMTGRPWRSGVVAALFAIHPLHVESVAWVAERKDVLSGLFWMLVMSAYARFVDRRGAGAYALTLALFALGLLCKPMLVTLPLVLLLLDYWPLARTQGPGDGEQGTEGKKRLRSLLLEKAPLLAMSVGAGVAAVWAQSAGGALADMQSYPAGVRIANALVAYVGYLVKALWPARLAVYYPHPHAALPVWQVMGSVALLMGVTALVIAFRRRRPYVLVGWLWYLITMLPVIGLVQVGEQAMADRYTYLPLIGIFVMVVWLVPEPSTTARRVLYAACTAAMMAGLCCAAYTQVGYWRSAAALFGHAIRVTNNNDLAYNNMGSALLEEGDPRGALQNLRKAEAINPDDGDIQNNLGRAYRDCGDLPSALEHLQAAVEYDPMRGSYQGNLGIVLAKMNRLPEALDHFRAAVRLRPEDVGGRMNLAQCLFLLGHRAQAEKEFRAALELDPRNPELLSKYAALLASTGRVDQAVSMARKAVEASPNDTALRQLLDQLEAMKDR